MARDQLDLRGKTMTELMEMDKEAGNGLSFFPEQSSIPLRSVLDQAVSCRNLLADRR